MSPKDWLSTGGGQRQQPVFTGIVVNNFISFHFIEFPKMPSVQVFSAAAGPKDRRRLT
jgi:hypothetical protein